MNIKIPLNKMTIAEKLQIMEKIWGDLSNNADNIESPSWHKDILDAREQDIKNGKSRFVDWEKAKRQIRDSVL